MFGSMPIRTDQHKALLCQMAVAIPDLLSVNHQFVTVEAGLGRQGGQV